MTYRSPGRVWFPHPPGQGFSYVHWTTSLPNLYIRNIIPDDMGIPSLAVLALSIGVGLCRLSRRRRELPLYGVPSDFTSASSPS
jgi:hypothetical protein